MLGFQEGVATEEGERGTEGGEVSSSSCGSLLRSRSAWAIEDQTACMQCCLYGK